MNDESTVDFGKEIIPQSIDKRKVMSYPFEGYWTDIGNIDSFFEANLGLTDDIPSFNLYDLDNRVFYQCTYFAHFKNFRNFSK